MMANPIGATVTAGVVLYQNWESIAPLFRGIGDALAATGRALGVWGNTLAGVVGSAFRAIADAIGFNPMPTIRAMWEPVSAVFTTVWDGVRGIVGGAIDWIGDKLDAFAGKLTWFADMVGSVLRQARDAWNALVGAKEGAEAPLPERGQPSAADPKGEGLRARVEERHRQQGRRAGPQPIEGFNEETPLATRPARTDYSPQPAPVEGPTHRPAPPAAPPRPQSHIERAFEAQARTPPRRSANLPGTGDDTPPPAPPAVGATQQPAAAPSWRSTPGRAM